ncbi:MAG: Diaminopimelate epimerase [Firmicutes bacterium ADurb.Bin153]|nr:MAG: Diaminopimelate epimerase [Firmicutes bacterium ADurb.Bin153]
MEFYKMHGLGNDFVFTMSGAGGLERLQGMAKKVCDRNFGVGADGLIVLVPSEKADFRMVIFNSDGSEAEMCGNAIRCAAVLWAQKNPGAMEPFAIETLKGIQLARITDRTGKDWKVAVDMGEPALAPSDIPVEAEGDSVVDMAFTAGGEELEVTCVSMGNPHAVAFVDRTGRDIMMRLGPLMEKHPAFPRKTNVEFAQVLGDGGIRVFVWERGVGPTLACGSGACAVAVAAAVSGRAGRRSRIDLPGGSLDIEWSKDDGHVIMTGPASFVFKGKLTDSYAGGWED